MELALSEATASLSQSLQTKAPSLAGVLDGIGVKSLRRVFPDAGEYEPRTRREGLHRFYYVEFDPELPPTKAAGELKAQKGIVSVTPQLPVRLRAFNDPYFGSQWHYYNTRYKGFDINVQKVWDEFTTGSSEVIVSVVDEGVFMEHEDLAANLVPCMEDGHGSYNFNNDTPTVVPTQGHGTHVAGVIAAINNNGIGVAGIAGGDAMAGKSGVKVMSCQIFDLYGAEPDIYQAIKHGADNGAVILQCSWGFSPDLNGDGFTTDEEIELYRSFTIDDLPEYKAAIDYFIKYAGCDNDGNQLPGSPMKGGIAVFAAGNDNFDFDPLVSYEPIIAVGAFGATGNKASYSNYGDWLDIAAPGGDAKQGIYSTLLSNTYGGSDWQGTSMACPHVSGVAALLASYFGGPGFTAEECKARILRGAVSNGISGSRYVGRKLDAYGAFTCDWDAPLEPPVFTISSDVPQISYKEVARIPFTVTDPRGEKVWVKLAAEQDGVTLESSSETEYCIVVDASALRSGSQAVTVTARNEDGATAELVIPFVIMLNRPPQVAQEGAAETLLLEDESQTKTVDVKTLFTDPDGDPLTFTFVESDPKILSLSMSDDGILTVGAQSYGLTSLILYASDGTSSASHPMKIAVRNSSEAAYVYPTEVSKELYVAIGAQDTEELTVEVYSSTGANVLYVKGSASIFMPYTLQVGGMAPGVYTAYISYGTEKVKATFVKI